ncbi:MAG: 1-acyl-sn-glycerol-3-phosphate acyltransferase [Spirochaetia bacterium]|nr:1-acyl-sn-glycerol-3-phosphate acyltransferase [Spirochaetia bacterium]
MEARTHYTPYNLRWFNKILRWFYGSYLRSWYRMKAIGADMVADIKGPYVLIPNHQSLLDPFMISTFVPQSIYWVTSDANMRSRIMRFLLRLVGSIPKSKVIPDLVTVNWIVDVVRRRGGVVGIFAEGQSSWDGHTLPLIPSTAKMVKLLKVPVVVATLRGVYHSRPRWSWHPRRGRVEIEFRKIFDGPELKAMDSDSILDILTRSMEYDEDDWHTGVRIPYRGGQRARHLELALFMCPHCGRVGDMRSAGNRLYCHYCGHTARLSPYYRFRPVGQSVPRFQTIRQWMLWQKDAFAAFVREASAKPHRPILSDSGVMLLKGRRMRALKNLRTGTLVMYPDRVELATLSGERLAFPLATIEGAGVQKQQRFEFYVGRDLYQFRFPLRRQSGLKWLLAVQELQAMMGMPAASPA